MNTAELDPSSSRHSEKTGSRIPRILAMGAALGLACAALAGTAAPAMAAPPAPHGATAQSQAHDDRAAHHRHGGWDDDGDDCDGLIVLICHG
ncbi:hypothetical protein ACIRPX_40455 [Streptomyces sp. NPDC101225]|uniref:hypothetical protein n=1 Tax=Streptomyces sp. NPDC101225 TaxID=3366135 RepID=UPI0037F7E59E